MTGGEPYLTDDLPELIAGVAALRRRRPEPAQVGRGHHERPPDRRVLASTERMARDLGPRAGSRRRLRARRRRPPARPYPRRAARWQRLEKTLDGLVSLPGRPRQPHRGREDHSAAVQHRRARPIVEYADSRGLFTIIPPSSSRRSRLNARTSSRTELHGPAALGAARVLSARRRRLGPPGIR